MAGKRWTEAPADLRLSVLDRCRIVGATAPYVFRHAVRREFRASPASASSTGSLRHPEFQRVVHDVYCAMFLRGYRESTGYRVDPATGLAVVLFAVFMYVLDDEFEERRRRGAETDVAALIGAPGVAEVWNALGAYLRATGHADEILRFITGDFFGAGFDDYRRDIQAAETDGGLPATLRAVEFDAGETLRTVYHVIRLFNGHPYHHACAEEFRNLGIAGKFLDDLADYSADVSTGSPNLLDASAAETPTDFATARAALAAGELVTMRWWQERCPDTYEPYISQTFRYYNQVHAPRLRLTLDIYYFMLRTRKFWTVSTVRTRGNGD